MLSRALESPRSHRRTRPQAVITPARDAGRRTINIAADRDADGRGDEATGLEPQSATHV